MCFHKVARVHYFNIIINSKVYLMFDEYKADSGHWNSTASMLL